MNYNVWMIGSQLCRIANLCLIAAVLLIGIGGIGARASSISWLDGGDGTGAAFSGIPMGSASIIADPTGVNASGNASGWGSSLLLFVVTRAYEITTPGYFTLSQSVSVTGKGGGNPVTESWWSSVGVSDSASCPDVAGSALTSNFAQSLLGYAGGGNGACDVFLAAGSGILYTRLQVGTGSSGMTDITALYAVDLVPVIGADGVQSFDTSEVPEPRYASIGAGAGALALIVVIGARSRRSRAVCG